MSKEFAIRIERQVDIVPRLTQAEVLIGKGLPAGPVEVVVRRPNDKRTAEMNRRLWAVLTDVAQQVEWYGQYLAKEDWKCIFSASLERQKVVPGLDQGTFVAVGAYTSKMTKKKFGDLLTLIDAFGADHNVRWSDPALKAFAEYKEAIA